MKRNIFLGLLLALLCVNASAATLKTVAAGATDQSVTIRIVDLTDGSPETGVVFNTSGIDLKYWRHGANAVVDITEVTQTINGAHSDGGFVAVGFGVYRLDLPDAAVAAGTTAVDIIGTVTGMVVIGGTVEISPPVNTVAIGGTTQTARDLGASVLISSGTGTGQLSVTSGVIASNVTQFGGSAGTFASGRPEVNTSHIAGSAVSTSTAQIGVNVVNWGGTAVASARPLVDAVQISGDSGAADALETAFDGTTGSVAPMGIARQGTAQSASGTTLVLDTNAAFADDVPIGMTLVACGSTQGYCQSRGITDYVGSTDTATVSTWTVTPSGTITYYLFSTAPVSGSGGSGATAQEVWEYATRSLTIFDEDSTTIDINATTIGTVTTATNVTTVNGLAANVITAAATATDFGTEVGTATWATTTRLLTAGTNIVLAKGTGVTGFNDLDAAGIRSAVGLTTNNLDGQLSTIDTVVDAIKVKTDQLTFGVTNTLNVNVEYMNAEAMCGTGDSGNAWTGCP